MTIRAEDVAPADPVQVFRDWYSAIPSDQQLLNGEPGALLEALDYLLTRPDEGIQGWIRDVADGLLRDDSLTDEERALVLDYAERRAIPFDTWFPGSDLTSGTRPKPDADLGTPARLFADWYAAMPQDPRLLDTDKAQGIELLEYLFERPRPGINYWIYALADRLLQFDSWTPDERTRLVITSLRGVAGRGDGAYFATRVIEVAGRFIRASRHGEATRALEFGLEVLGRDSENALYLLPELADIAQYRQEWNGALALLDELEAGLARSETAPEVPRIRHHLLRAQVADAMGLPDVAASHLPLARELLESSATGLPSDWRWLAYMECALLQTRKDFHGAAEAALDALAHDEWFERPSDRTALRATVGGSYLILAEDGEHELLDAAREPLERILAEAEIEVASRITTRVSLAQIEFLAGDPAAASDHVRAARRLEREHSPELSPHQFAQLTSLEVRGLQEAGAGPAELTDAWERLSSDFERLMDHWRATPQRAGGVGYLQAERTAALLGQLIRLDVELTEGPEGAVRGLNRWIAVQGSNSLFRSLRSPLPSASDLQAALGPGEVLLTYVPGTDSSHLFALERSAITHTQLPNARSVRRPLREYSLLVSTPPEGEQEAMGEREARLASLGRELAEWTWPEGVRDIVSRAERVTIVGGDLFPRLCFESLPLDGDTPIGITHRVAHLPALPLLTALRARGLRAEARDVDLLLVARVGANGQDHAEGLEPLPIADADLERLMSPFAGAGKQLLAGDAGTLQVASRTRHAAVTHFLTHGVEDPSRERARGIVLEDRSVFGSDVADWPASPLVILSACGPGRGPFRRGDDGLDLGGALLGAGALAVIQSECGLSYLATRTLMETVHRELAAGASPAEALRAAREALSRQDRFRDPYYHALLRVEGLGHLAPLPARESKSPSPGAWIPAAVVAFLLGALLSRWLLRGPAR